MRTTIKSLTASVLLAASAIAMAQNQPVAPDAATVVHAFESNGLVTIYNLEYRANIWTAEATTTGGERVDVLYDNGNVIMINRAAIGTTALTSVQVRQKLSALGYHDFDDIDFDDGLWEVEARRHSDHVKVDLLVHPVTGTVLQETVHGDPTTPGYSGLGRAEIYQALINAGYTRIDDLEFDDDDNLWEADAYNARGREVDLKIDAHTGQVVREKLD